MPHDIFMLAYGEPNAAENWARLKATAPKHLPEPRLVENVPGLFASYSTCARMSTTPWFFLVDADNWILDGFDFALPFEPAADEIAIWGATNPFNHLYYGHGGIKLLPAALFETPEAQADAARSIDFTITMARRNRFVDVKASEHRFNTSRYGTWGAVFRECVKLAVAATRGGFKQRAVARYRLEHWLKPNPEAPFAEWCRLGADDGRRYGREFRRDEGKLNRINDYAWLRATFARRQEMVAPKPAYDVFMIAHGEKSAAENWARLRQCVPEARLVENVSGIGAGYAACAAAATTDHFFAVDADNWVLDGFRFQVPFEPKRDETLFWYARNPVNGLEYGHGAIKLFPTALLKQRAGGAAPGGVDFSTSVGRIRYTEICASEHRFNGDAFAAWAGAFRECAKLANGTTIGTAESQALAKLRLDAWCERRRKDAAFGDWCLKGAAEGREFGAAHAGDYAGLARINDFTWLRATFRARHVRKIEIPSRS
jgi:hypothetical protein